MQTTVSPSYTTFSVFRYSGFAKWWALQQMGVLPSRLKHVKGLQFFRLLGSGKGQAFSITPDWSRYMLLAVWSSKEAAEAFFSDSPIVDAVRSKAEEIWMVKMEPIQAKGLWSGVNPFVFAAGAVDNAEAPVAVLTRATIKPSLLFNFARHAIKASEAVSRADGLVFSCGIGERPFTRQATFSIWQNMAAMKAFAYGMKDHKDVIREKSKQKWYSEELFARFSILGTVGTYMGQDPLQGIFKSEMAVGTVNK
jgi:heme-degrading monooxygenase HmoA